MSLSEYDIGFGRLPEHSRFKAGRCGEPKVMGCAFCQQVFLRELPGVGGEDRDV